MKDVCAIRNGEVRHMKRIGRSGCEKRGEHSGMSSMSYELPLRNCDLWQNSGSDQTLQILRVLEKI